MGPTSISLTNATPTSGRISLAMMPRQEQAERRLIPSREIALDMNRNRRGVSPAVPGMVSSQLLVAAAVTRWLSASGDTGRISPTRKKDIR
jgi:hypothetical protein